MRSPAPDPTHRPPAAAPSATNADPLVARLFEALLDPADGRLATVAGHHGRLRARDDGTLAALLHEYAALRQRLVRSPDAGIALHSALDHASAAAASAFWAERARQQEVLRRGLDHALRGGVNAIRLAGFVQRQTGRDTADVVERHTASLAALLDRARDALAPRDATALRPADLPPADLAAACRQQILEWNDRHAALRCTFVVTNACVGYFDIARVGETLAAMVEAAAGQAGAGAALSAALGSARGMAVLTVEGVAPAGTRPVPAGVTPTQPWIWQLAHQTAAAHHGRLDSEPGVDRVVFRLALRHAEADAGASDPTAATAA